MNNFNYKNLNVFDYFNLIQNSNRSNINNNDARYVGNFNRNFNPSEFNRRLGFDGMRAGFGLGALIPLVEAELLLGPILGNNNVPTYGYPYNPYPYPYYPYPYYPYY